MSWCVFTMCKLQLIICIHMFLFIFYLLSIAFVMRQLAKHVHIHNYTDMILAHPVVSDHLSRETGFVVLKGRSPKTGFTASLVFDGITM